MNSHKVIFNILFETSIVYFAGLIAKNFQLILPNCLNQVKKISGIKVSNREYNHFKGL
jgi:hypothetical protein